MITAFNSMAMNLKNQKKMDDFLAKYKCLNLTQEKVENLNKTVP